MGVWLVVCVGDGLRLLVELGVVEGLRLEVRVTEGVADGVMEGLPDAVGVGVAVAVGLGLVVRLSVGLTVHVIDDVGGGV